MCGKKSWFSLAHGLNQYGVCMFMSMRVFVLSCTHAWTQSGVCCSPSVCRCGPCEIDPQGLPLCLELIPGCAAQINVQWEQEPTIRKVLAHFKLSESGLLWQTHTANVNIFKWSSWRRELLICLRRHFCNNTWHTCFEQEGNCFMSANYVLLDLLRSD